MTEPAAKKLKGAGSYDFAYKEEWADSYPVGPINENKGAFYCIPCKKVQVVHNKDLETSNNTVLEKHTKIMLLLLHKVIR